MRRCRAVVLALGVIPACRELPHIRGGACGNRVLESGEQCDEGPSSTLCHAPGTLHQCEFDCSHLACPSGYGCGSDDVCRAPSGRLHLDPLDAGNAYASLGAGDLNGDGTVDVLATSWMGSVSITFDRGRTKSVQRNESVSGWLSVLGEVDGDGRVDAVSYGLDATEVQILRAGKDGGLTPLSQFFHAPTTASASPGARRLFAGDIDGDGHAEALMLAEQSVFVIRFPMARFDPIGEITLSSSQTVGNVAVGNLADQVPCDEFALASPETHGVHVYAACEGRIRELAAVLVVGKGEIGEQGVFTGDVDGDGALDLIAANRDDEGPPFVAYGLGDGTFDSRVSGRPGADGDNAFFPLLFAPQESLLAVGNLDGDQKADFVYWGSTVLSRRLPFACERAWGDSCVVPHEPWLSAAIGDFNRDGIPDQIGVPLLETYELRFALGTGDGYNAFAVPTEGTPQSLSKYGAPLLVGDFDGDLVSDVIFTETLRAGGETSATILFGQPYAKPMERRSIGTVTGPLVAAAGPLLNEPGRDMDDIVMLGETAGGPGVGVFVGQTSRALYSPLPLPEEAETRESLTIESVALGRFRSAAHGGDEPAGDHASPREDLAIVVTNARSSDWLLYFVPNSEAGFLGAASDPRPMRLEPPAFHTSPGLTALDVDGDGVDELAVFPTLLEGPRFVYWVAERRTRDFAPTRGQSVDLSSLRWEGAWSVWPGPEPRDVDGDGRTDLALMLSAKPDRGPARQALLLLRATPQGTLGSPLLFPLDPLQLNANVENIGLGTFAFLNSDGDPAPELAVGVDDQIVLADLDVEAHSLRRIATLPAAGVVSSVAAGDYDGDGVDDVAVGTDSGVRLFWQEAKVP